MGGGGGGWWWVGGGDHHHRPPPPPPHHHRPPPPPPLPLQKEGGIQAYMPPPLGGRGGALVAPNSAGEGLPKRPQPHPRPSRAAAGRWAFGACPALDEFGALKALMHLMHLGPPPVLKALRPTRCFPGGTHRERRRAFRTGAGPKCINCIRC